VAHALDAPPLGAVVSDHIDCVDGHATWKVSMANVGPNATIDYTIQVDQGAIIDVPVGIGPLVVRQVQAKHNPSNLRVTADGAEMVDTGGTIECAPVPST